MRYITSPQACALPAAAADTTAARVKAVTPYLILISTLLYRFHQKPAVGRCPGHYFTPPCTVLLPELAAAITGSAVIAKNTGTLQELGAVSRSSVAISFSGCGLGRRGSLISS